MLRASAERLCIELALRAIGQPSIDPLLEGGKELLDFTSALVAGDRHRLSEERAKLVAALGSAAAIAAAACAGNFQMMNRLLDSTGVPLPRDRMIAKDLGLALDWPGNLTD